MSINNYKINQNDNFTKNLTKETENINDHRIKYILDIFPYLNGIPCNEIFHFSATLKTFINEATEEDFDILFFNEFHEILKDYIINETKINIFVICVDILNQIIKNSKAKRITYYFLEPDFANFIFLTSTHFNQLNAYTLPSQKKMHSKLLKILINLFKNDLSLFDSLDHSLFFQDICQFYQMNINLSTSIRALEILIFILSQDKIDLLLDEIEPVFAIAEKYISQFVISINENIDHQYITMSYEELSKMCQLIIQLTQRNLDYFYQSFNIYNFFPLLSYSNQICSCSLIELIIFILSLPNVPVKFIKSIKWEIIDNSIKKFNALKSNDSSFIIKICHLIESLVPYKEIDLDKLGDLISFLNEGSFKVQVEALKLICTLFLKDSDRLFELDFQIPLSENILLVIFDFLENNEDIELIVLLLSTLEKSIDYFQQIDDIETISMIQNFCHGDGFQAIFDKFNDERLIPFEQTFLSMID